MLEDGEYRAVELNMDADGTVWGHSPLLGLDLYAPAGEGRLRLYDPVKGEWLRNLPESEAALMAAQADLAATQSDLAATEVERDLERQARLAAEARRESERQARLAAEAERDAAQERIRRLEEQLRRQQDS